MSALGTPHPELIDHTARTHIEHVRHAVSEVKHTLDEVRKDVSHVGTDVHLARMEFTKGIHDALLKMAPLTVWVKILSLAAITLTFGVFSLVGTLIWKKTTERLPDAPPVSQWKSERVYPDQAEAR